MISNTAIFFNKADAVVPRAALKPRHESLRCCNDVFLQYISTEKPWEKQVCMLHYYFSFKRFTMTGAVEHTPRRAALHVLDRVDGGAYADIVLDKELRGLSASDAGLATEIVYGVLRWRIRLDWTIDSFSTMKTARLERSVLNALRIGLYQLLFLTRVPASAAINESVNLVKRGGRRKAGFVNAVLRKVDLNRELRPVDGGQALKLSIELSHPEWLFRRGIERVGAEGGPGAFQGEPPPPPENPQGQLHARNPRYPHKRACRRRSGGSGDGLLASRGQGRQRLRGRK